MVSNDDLIHRAHASIVWSLYSISIYLFSFVDLSSLLKCYITSHSSNMSMAEDVWPTSSNHGVDISHDFESDYVGIFAQGRFLIASKGVMKPFHASEEGSKT